MESSQKNHEDLVEEKLFTLKDIEGNEQYEVIETIGRLGDFLRKKDQRVKGISVIGSTVKGYAMPEMSKISDIDISLVYDDPSMGDKKDSEVSYRAQYDWIPEFNRENNIDIHFLSEINLSTLDRHVVCDLPGAKLKDLIFPFFGNMSEYNNIIQAIKDMIVDMNEAQKDAWINNFARTVVSYESTTKIKDRTGVEPYQHIESRLKLYKERIKELFMD